MRASIRRATLRTMFNTEQMSQGEFDELVGATRKVMGETMNEGPA